MALKQLPIQIFTNMKKVFLSGVTIAILLVASAQIEFDYEKGELNRAHVSLNGTWIQPFIPPNWLRLVGGSSSSAIGRDKPKRLLPSAPVPVEK